MHNLADISWASPSLAVGKLWIPVLISIIFAGFGRAVRGVTTSGAVAGALVCFALLVGAGPSGFVALFVVFLLTGTATRVGYARKQGLGTAEPRSGRKAAQVFANLGVAAISALIYAIVWRDPRLLIAMAAALAEAAADTVSSEIGQAVGSVPRLVTNWKLAPSGTDGAITLAGTAAGVVAAIAVSLTSVLGIGLGWRAAPICAAAGILGMIADSLLGATLERRGFMGNNAVNFSSTAIAALIAFLTTRVV
jgi:uncharacterized protein (TIGR00297 family)